MSTPLVHFHPLLVTSISRKPSNAELFIAYSLHFHAANCRKCKNDLSCHISERIAVSITDRLSAGPDGNIYSITAFKQLKVRVEMPRWLSIYSYLKRQNGDGVGETVQVDKSEETL